MGRPLCVQAKASAARHLTLASDDREELALTIAPLLLRAVLGAERKCRACDSSGTRVPQWNDSGHMKPRGLAAASA
jgi:hypothetical protein